VSGRCLSYTNRVRLFRDAADTLTAMLDLIEGADQEIPLQALSVTAHA
jgi:hypothetical protein